MIPSDFVDLAVRLSANPSEAAQRSAISRAYYGAFHAAKRLIESCGFKFAGAGETHQHLPYCMRQSTDKALVAAGRRLDSLRLTRNMADYDLDDPPASSRGFVAVQLQAAREILDAVDAAAERLPTFARQYATTPRTSSGRFSKGTIDFPPRTGPAADRRE